MDTAFRARLCMTVNISFQTNSRCRMQSLSNLTRRSTRNREIFKTPVLPVGSDLLYILHVFLRPHSQIYTVCIKINAHLE